ncbi:hypothetical protein LX64_00440 [Chitinophaga skermanii]|uniref:Uncharacterized protein n=1 Tax=Chitinophaga skermanii TaxID=331697 RepID=A0A327R5G3_9BACT|nr:hypothetical protein LX64_00440 [Chitinophaga skermanii]
MNVDMIKPYRYIIYKLMSSLAKRNSSPKSGTLAILTFVHFFYVSILILIVSVLFPSFGSHILTFNRVGMILYLLGLFAVNYFVFYFRRDWDAYIQEFSGESRTQKLWGNIFVILYVFAGMFLAIKSWEWVASNGWFIDVK